MDIKYIRKCVLSLYPSSNWTEKVALMSDKQVSAIYFRTKRQYPKKEEKDDGVQLSMF